MKLLIEYFLKKLFSKSAHENKPSIAKYTVQTNQNKTVKIKYWRNSAGQLHREDGPAVEGDGTRAWYLNGIRHRENGPALEHDSLNDTPAYWSWWKHGKLHREDGPAKRNLHGIQSWFHEGQIHREGAPALISENSDYTCWYQFGQKHREDGPAVERPDGQKQWWVRGKRMSEKEFQQWSAHKEKPSTE